MGTFARALDKPTTGKMSLVEAASVSARDCTLLSAYKFMHEGNFFWFIKFDTFVIIKKILKSEFSIFQIFFQLITILLRLARNWSLTRLVVKVRWTWVPFLFATSLKIGQKPKFSFLRRETKNIQKIFWPSEMSSYRGKNSLRLSNFITCGKRAIDVLIRFKLNP